MAKTKKTSAKAAKKKAPAPKKAAAKKKTAVKSKASAKKDPEKKETVKKPVAAAAPKKAAKAVAPARKSRKSGGAPKGVQTKLKLGFSDGEGAEGEDEMEMPDDFKGFDEGFYDSDMDDDDDDF